jgi:GT2 family glycosyltransferase
MNTPKISVILPTYNRVDSLKECLNSLQNQKYKNWELIIVDDSSSKDVEEFVTEFKTRDSRIKYHKNQIRKGLPGSRNVGISISENFLILFIEDDIILDINSMEILVDAYNRLSSNNVKIGAIAPSRPWICSPKKGQSVLDYALRYKNNNLKSPCVRGKYTGIVYFNFNSGFSDLQEVEGIHSCSLYTRSAIEDAEGYDEINYGGNFLYEETDLNYRILSKGYKFYFEPKAIFYHKSVAEGGCRVKALNYAYFFILNHVRFLTKNFGLKSLYMIPLFLIFISYTAILAIFNLSMTSFSSFKGKSL